MPWVCSPSAPEREGGGAPLRLGADGFPEPVPVVEVAGRAEVVGERDLGGLGGANRGMPDHPPENLPRPRPR